MSFLDRTLSKAKKQLTSAVGKHGDTINQGLDRAAAEADKRTGGKHRDKIAKGVSAAKGGLGRLDGAKDNPPSDTPPEDRPTTYPRTDDTP